MHLCPVVEKSAQQPAAEQSLPEPLSALYRYEALVRILKASTALMTPPEIADTLHHRPARHRNQVQSRPACACLSFGRAARGVGCWRWRLSSRFCTCRSYGSLQALYESLLQSAAVKSSILELLSKLLRTTAHHHLAQQPDAKKA